MTIPLGFEVPTGKRIEIPLRHTAVFGQTQESGKTTTLEGLINRSGLRGLAFVTKRGESSFHVMNPIAPYFRERTDWRFVSAILEATLSEKLKVQRSFIMKLCQAGHGKSGKTQVTWPSPRTLADVYSNVRTALITCRQGTFVESIYFELAEYLKDIIPQIDRLPYTTTLELAPGVNVMDLAPYDFPLQALVVRSSMEWIRKRERDCVLVVPESHKFAPKQRGSPVKLEAEDFIRESAALHNYLWIDCQDVAGVADVLLRQIGVWIFGVQRAKHEIERTLDAIPEGLIARRPKAGEIATLSKGQFFVCWGREMFKVYVQPAWMTAAHAEAISRGEEEVETAREILKDFDRAHPPSRKTGAPAGEPAEAPAAGAKAERKPHQQLQILEEGDADGEIEVGRSEDDKEKQGSGLSNQRQPDGLSASDDRNPRRAGEARSLPGSPPSRGTEEAMKGTAAETLAAYYHGTHGLGGRMDMGDFHAAVQSLLEDHQQLIQAHDAMAERVKALEGALGHANGPSKRAAVSAAEPGAGAAVAGPGAASSPDTNHESRITGNLEEIYLYVRQRAQRDPNVLQILATRPELRVKVEVPVQEINGDTFFGRIAQLVQTKFFAEPRPIPVVLKEAIRRGWCSPKTPHIRMAEPLDKLTTMGFLTNEGKDVGYQQVPGMKISVAGGQ